MPLAAAGISAGASILGGITGGKAAKKAAKQQAAMFQQGIDEQRRQFDATQANFAPYQTAGTQGLGGMLDLVGLNGGDTQGAAISALKASPAFTSLYGTGQDTILQNAAATGGLRGGNTQNSLAQFGSSLLADTIQRQLANYGGLANTGVGAAGAVGQFGQNTANSISGMMGQQGGAMASGTLGAANSFQNTLNSLSSIGGRYFNPGGLSGQSMNTVAQQTIAANPRIF